MRFSGIKKNSWKQNASKGQETSSKYNSLQAKHSQKLPFGAFNICTFWGRISKVTDSQKQIYLNKNVLKPDQYFPVQFGERDFAFC